MERTVQSHFNNKLPFSTTEVAETVTPLLTLTPETDLSVDVKVSMYYCDVRKWAQTWATKAHLARKAIFSKG